MNTSCHKTVRQNKVNSYQSVGRRSMDGAGQISRDPRTKRHQTRRKWLGQGFKTNRMSLTGQYLAIHIPKSIVRTSNTSRDNRDFTIRFIFFNKPAISMLERVDALIFSLKVSRVGGGVQGQQAVFSLAPRLYSKPLGAHRVDSERRHLLPTQNAQQGQGGCASCLRGERRRERRSVFVSATSSVAGMPWGTAFPYVLYLCFVLF